MPVRKFRSVEDMAGFVWRDPGDPELMRAMAGLWDIARRTRRRSFPPGVHRHGSLEDMQLAQERWEDRPASP